MIPQMTQMDPAMPQAQPKKPLKAVGGFSSMQRPAGPVPMLPQAKPTIGGGQGPQPTYNPATQPSVPGALPQGAPAPATPALGETPAMTGQAPDRMALVNSALADYDAQNKPGLQQRMRQVGQYAAKFGRTGAGMTTNDLTGLEQGYERGRALFGNQLIRGGIEGTIGDQQQAVQNAIQRLLVGDQLTNSALQRGVTAGSYGEANSPAGLESFYSSQHAGAANDAFSSIGDLLKQYALSQMLKSGGQ